LEFISKTPKHQLAMAIVTYYYSPLYGGLETQLLILSKFLVMKGFRVTVYTSRPVGTTNEEIDAGVRILRFGKSETVRGLEEAYNEIITKLEKSINNFDILYMPFGISPKYPISLQLKVAGIFFAKHKPVVLRITSSGRITELLHFDSKLVSFLKQVSKIIALNSGIALELRNAGVKNKSIFRVNNSVDVNRFKPIYISETKNSHNNKELRFIYPCRICEKKNIKDIIFDWNKASTLDVSFQNAQLLIVGDTNRGTEDRLLFKEILKLVDLSKSKISILPALNYQEMPDLYRKSDILLCYSLQEGMSNTTLEAMASGLPIISPSTEAFHELLIDSPNYIFKDSLTRIDTLLKAIRDYKEWNRIGLFNRKRIIKKFSTDVILPKYYKMFINLVSN